MTVDVSLVSNGLLDAIVVVQFKISLLYRWSSTLPNDEY